MTRSIRAHPLAWGAVTAVLLLAVGALAIGPAGAADQKGLTKKKADKRYLQNTTLASNTVNVPPDTGVVITALCPPGMQATDGGNDSPSTFTSAGDFIIMTESYPVLGGARSVGWQVEVVNVSDTETIPASAQAVCVR
jgi:hypothetical protein